MNGTAPTRFAAWMAAHEHRDAKLGFVYRYHPRRDHCGEYRQDVRIANPAEGRKPDRHAAPPAGGDPADDRTPPRATDPHRAILRRLRCLRNSRHRLRQPEGGKPVDGAPGTP